MWCSKLRRQADTLVTCESGDSSNESLLRGGGGRARRAVDKDWVLLDEVRLGARLAVQFTFF